jgi:hypothetical protein
MGNWGDHKTPSKRSRPGLVKKTRVVEIVRIAKNVAEKINDVAKARAMEQKRFYREQQRATRNAMLQQTRVLHNVEESMLNKDVKKVAQKIYQTISFQLIVFP